MTDDQWIKQNKKMHPGKAIAAGKCWKCAGNGKLHGAFGGEQILVVCPECKGTGAPAKVAA
jgi:DnaJ-class molecular chaperone